MNHASIEVITEFVPTPRLRATCSHGCGMFIQMDCAPPETQPLEVALQVFLHKIRAAGWLSGLTGNACPQHVAKMRDEQPRIVTPGAQGILH